MEEFRPIRADRLSDKAVRQLVQRIRAGDLPPGTRLPNEEQLAGQLGVSRGILREALTILQLQGYITRAPREGTVVCNTYGNELGSSFALLMRSADHKSLMELREAIECRAIRSVISSASDKDIESLIALLSGNLPAHSRHRPDYFFHYKLAELSGNPLFCAFIDLYYDALREKSFSMNADIRENLLMLDEHARIAEAVRNRDAKAALAAMRSHLRRVEKNTVQP